MSRARTRALEMHCRSLYVPVVILAIAAIIYAAESGFIASVVEHSMPNVNGGAGAWTFNNPH